MTEQRKQEVISALLGIAESFKPTEDDPDLSMFWLVSHYNATGQNVELIGGAWVREHVPELADIPD